FSLSILASNFDADFEATVARRNAMRFCVTAWRESHSVKLRLSAAIPLSRLAPPFRVLKPWTTHGTESKILAVRISGPEMRRSAQPSSTILAAGLARRWLRITCALGMIGVSRGTELRYRLLVSRDNVSVHRAPTSRGHGQTPKNPQWGGIIRCCRSMPFLVGRSNQEERAP